MYLKCRHTGVFFLIFIATIPCYCLTYYDAAQKMRADNIEDYGERLSSIERGRRGSTELKKENKGIEKLGGILESKPQEDIAQEEGMSVQEAPVVKLQDAKSSSTQVLSKEVDNVNQKEELQEPQSSSKQVPSKEEYISPKNILQHQNIVDAEESSKELKGKQLKPEENDVSLPEKESENASKIDLTEEHESKNEKQKGDAINLDVESSTKCTTDREVTIGDYKPPEDSHTNEHSDGEAEGKGDGKDDGEGDGKDDDKEDVEGDGQDDGKGDGDGDSKGDGESEDQRPNIIDDSDEPEKTVSKVYKGPKPAKAPDHYIDDI